VIESRNRNLPLFKGGKTMLESRWLALSLLIGSIFVVLAGAVPPASAQSAKSDNDAIELSFTFRKPHCTTAEVNGSSYASLVMPGSAVMARNAGEPALPVQFVRILLPPGKEVAEVEVSGAMTELKLDGVDLTRTPVFPYQSPLPIGTAQPADLALNEKIYNSADQFPAANYGTPRMGHCRGYTIYSLALFPVKYKPAAGQLFIHKKMTVALQLKKSPAGINTFLRQDSKADEAWIRNMVCNPAALANYQRIPPGRLDYPGGLCDPADHYDYVIITTSQNSLDDWATSGTTPYNWDSLMNRHTVDDGLACTLVTIQDINAEAAYQNPNPLFDDTAAHIREFCKDAYEDWGTSYILVGADVEWVPAREMDYLAESDIDSDIYYNHLDLTFNDDQDNYWGEEGDAGFDLYAEMFIGRVTCDVPQDVSNWLTKCFHYMDAWDRDYLNNAAFYGGDTGWNCQGDDFIDYSAIYGLDRWLGPDTSGDPYPPWLGFQYGFETWNQENMGAEYDMDVMWTAEPPNTGWLGGSSSAAITGLRNAISSDNCTLLSGIAHANEYMSLDVSYTSWESSYHNTRPFFIHDYGCHCGDMGSADDGVLHSMLFHSDTELAFACVYNTGYGWGNYNCTCSSSALQQKSFWDFMFDLQNNSGTTDNWQMGKAMAYARDLMAPTIDWDPYSGSWRGVIQCCLLFGDPAQRLKPPAVPALFMSFPNGLPSGEQPPGPEYLITVEIKTGLENYVPGTAFMNYRYDPLASFTSVALTSLGGDLFEAVLPNTSPGDEPEFYFEAQGDGGTTVYAPWNAPASVYSFDVFLTVELFHDDFETDTGWTVEDINVTTGTWERCDPNPTSGQQVAPVDDNPAGTGTQCYVTANGPSGATYSDWDVDGGPTRLISPTLDFSSGDANISFYYWFYGRDGDDPFSVDISNDDGATWTSVFTTMSSNSAWTYMTFAVGDYVTPTAQVKVRFSTQDQPNNSITEAGLDDFRIIKILYDASLWAEAYEIEGSVGCQIDINLDAGAAYANRDYTLGAGMSGHLPGTTLPSGKVLPLNMDAFTTLVLNNLNSPYFVNWRAQLDAQGRAVATLDSNGPVPAPYIGQTMTLAFTLQGAFDMVSNPIFIELNP